MSSPKATDKNPAWKSPTTRLVPFILATMCITYLILFVVTLPFYGVPFDEALGESFLGDRYFAFLTSLDWSHLDFTKHTLDIYTQDRHPNFQANSKYAIKNIHHIWGFGHIMGAATKWIFFTKLDLLDPIDATHLAPGLLVLGLCLAVYGFCRRYLSACVALSTVFFLAVHPRFWAHSHFNLKDIPEAVFFALTLLTFFHAFYAQKRLWLIASSALWGLALAIKANAVMIPLIGGFFLLLLYIRERKFINSSFLLPTSLLILPLLVLSFLIFLAAWPYLLLDFPTNLLLHIEFLQERGFESSSHWKLVPITYMVTTTPLFIIFLTLLGIARSIAALFRSSSVPSALGATLCFWLILPVLRVSIPSANDFDGIRHWIEFVPAMCILAGIGFDWIYSFLANSTISTLQQHAGRLTFLLLCLLATPTLRWQYGNNPHQYAYFNSLIGGLGGAQARKMPEATDYWGVSYRQALQWLNRNAPPESILYIGFAEHTVFYVKDIWLRPDITLRTIARFDADRVHTQTFKHPVYLLFATRPSFIPREVRSVDLTQLQPVYSTSVDGGLINVMYRLDKLRATGS